MDSFEINKIIAAVLLTALIIIGIGKFTDILFFVEKPKVSAYKIEGIIIAVLFIIMRLKDAKNLK